MSVLKKTGIVAMVSVAFLCTGCSEYQKVLKSTDVGEKSRYAEKLYEEGDYARAQRLFEQVLPRYVGKPQGERVLFFYADSQFRNGEYYLSGYQFDRFIQNYPQSDKTESAAFFGAQSFYELSPRYSLDQSDTDRALSKLQAFINSYPQSEYFERANEMIRELTRKKEKKEFEIAKQFDRLGEFNYPVLFSAVEAVDNFISENPGSIYKEEALLIKLRSSVNLAINSYENKKEERIEAAIEARDDLLKSFPDTRFNAEIEELMSRLEQSRGVPGYEQSR